MATTGADLNDLLRLDKSRVRPAVDVLVRAFWDYALLRCTYSDERQRRKVAPCFFRYCLHYGIRYGETCATSPNLEGVAVWIPSGSFPMTFRRVLRSVPLPVLIGFGREGGGSMKHAGDYLDAAHRRLAPFKHRFLQVIGVDPQFQGKGYAGKLLRPMLARMDEESLPCYLETLDEKNVRLYEHFGFEVLEQADIPRTGLTAWAMLRKPVREDGAMRPPAAGPRVT